ncbi:MAG: CHRD domain-containing protein [Acidobacteria bacterium]|nr:CHRD domain-containing protein [Acidobacteriota bacterium]
MQLSALVFALALAAAQAAPGPMRARLSPLPTDLAMQETIAGVGAATATLAGTTLTVEGTYRGLKSAATSVRVFDSPRPGLRGPLVGEFASGGGTTGTFKGTVTLTREQAAAFAKGLLYVQVQSEKAPDGNLWGWLMAPKGRR